MGKITNITVAGLGGQGVLKVTDILAEVLFAAGYDVKKSEVHGMSQRGGSVSSEVRFGDKVYSPMVPEGESDVLAVLEPTQVEVNAGKLKKGGVLITPADLPLDKLSNPKAANMVFLGAVAREFKDIPEAVWLEHMHTNLPEKLHAVNDVAFGLGYGSRA